MALKMNRIHCLLACLLAAASCQIPESERVPSVFTVTFATPTPEPLQESVQVDIRCDLHWTAQLSDESWGVIEVLNIQEGQGGQLLLKTGANLAESPRENTLIVKAGKSEQRIPFTQKGLEHFFYPRTLTLQGTTAHTVTFRSPASWSARVTEGSDWLVLRSASGGTGASSLVCAAVDANENVGERKAVIRVSIGPYNLDIPVTQVQKDVILGEESALSFPFDATEFSVKTHYNVGYEVSTSASWITRPEGKAPLNEALETFLLAENPDAASRTGKIHFTGVENPEVSFTLTITQEGKDPILNVSVPGIYGLEAGAYTAGTNGWNQSSYLKMADGSIRYRLLNAGMLSALTLTGASENLQRGDACSLLLELNERGTCSSATYPATLLLRQDGLSWFKGEGGVFFVIKK